MLVVADSSALIALAVCDALSLILQIYDDLKIPENASFVAWCHEVFFAIYSCSYIMRYASTAEMSIRAWTTM